MANHEHPTIDQLTMYHDLMLDILRRSGHYIRHGQIDDRATTRPGTEYLLPGGCTQWSQSSEDKMPKIEHDRSYSASYRSLGVHAARLIVFETDSHLSDDRTNYAVSRTIFRFSWDERVGVYEAEMMPMEIYSSATTDGEIVLAGNEQDKLILTLDHEATVADDETASHIEFVNPMGETESPWSPVTKDDIAQLYQRTAAYGDDLVAIRDRIPQRYLP